MSSRVFVELVEGGFIVSTVVDTMDTHTSVCTSMRKRQRTTCELG